MSNHHKSYVLTATAAGDFRQARRWSVAPWGKKRTRAYFQQLHDGAECIPTHQRTIAPRDDVTGNMDLGVYPVGEHYIVYAPIGDTQIVIDALFRQTRDVPAILKANSYRIRRQLTAALDKLQAGK